MTPQTTLEFRVWSHHTLKADALLGRATVDLKQVLLTYNRKLEKVKEILKLSLENKNGIVQTGELTVVLDGLVIDQENLTNHNSSPTIEVQQNGDALHEDGHPSIQTAARLAVEGTIGVDNHVPTNTVVPNSCCSHVVNGENTPSSPSQVAARPKNAPAPKPLASEPASDTVNGESSSSVLADNSSTMGTPLPSEETTSTSNCTSTTTQEPPVQEPLASSEHIECIPSTSAQVGPEAQSLIDTDSDSRNSSVFDKVRQPEGFAEPLRPRLEMPTQNLCHQGGNREKILMVEPIMWIIILELPHGRDHSLCLQDGKEELMIVEEFIMWIITPEQPPGRGLPWNLFEILNSGNLSGINCRELCNNSTNDTSIRLHC